ncbi:MAG: hypothetical protein P8X85_03965, partial [Desulfobacterales bacterium]
MKRHPLLFVLFILGIGLLLPGVAFSAAVAPIHQHTHEVVFVDPRLPDQDDLIADLMAQSARG